MRIRKFMTAALAACLSAPFTFGTAFAQVDPTLLIPEAVASRIGERNMINVATARRIADTCARMVEERDLGAAIVILDNFGNIVHAHRMDAAAGYISMHTAQLKAETAMRLRGPSKLRQNNVTREPAREAREWGLGFFPIAGGLPIWAGDQIIGFIGIGGMIPRPPEWSDEICAHRAMEEVVGPQPPLLDDISAE